MQESLIQKYRRKGILIDTNLLVGLLVGKFSPSQLANCRATKAFTEDDFSLLVRFVEQFDKLITTPHILTEVSNLAGKLPNGLLEGFRFVFGEVIQTLSEQPLPSKEIVKNAQFLRFGLTDTAITMIVPGSYLVLTDELALYLQLCNQNVDVINFNHIRTLGWTN